MLSLNGEIGKHCELKFHWLSLGGSSPSLDN